MGEWGEQAKADTYLECFGCFIDGRVRQVLSSALGTAYFATCITFFVDENHVARLAPKPLPVGRTAAFLFGSSLSRSCYTARVCDYVIKTSPVSLPLPAAVSSARHTAFKKITKNRKKSGFNCN